jgi:hypothetical protein
VAYETGYITGYTDDTVGGPGNGPLPLLVRRRNTTLQLLLVALAALIRGAR